MVYRALYDYIMENFTISGTTARLIENIICYAERGNCVDDEDVCELLYDLLDGFGLTMNEIKAVVQKSEGAICEE